MASPDIPPRLYPRNNSFRGAAVIMGLAALLTFGAMWLFR